MDLNNLNQCKQSHEDHSRCQRKTKLEYCLFHTPLEHTGRVTDRRFTAALRKILKNGETDLRGFIFPRNFSVTSFKALQKIDLSESEFQELNISKSDFESVLLCKKIIVSKRLSFNSSKIFSLECSDSEFQNAVIISAVSTPGNFSAVDCRFNGRFELSGSLEGNANFNGSYFSGRCIFSMKRSVTAIIKPSKIRIESFVTAVSVQSTTQDKFQKILSKLKEKFYFLQAKYKAEKKYVIEKIRNLYFESKRKTHLKYINIRNRFPYEQEGVDERRLFIGSSNLNNVVFEKPKLVLFRSVDLRRCSFEGTDMRGVNFLDCDWFQAKIGRNGVEYEHSLDSSDYHARRLFLPRIESVCRNLRQSMEENKDYLLSNDFFVGEMEAKRKQQRFLKRNLFSIIAWYNATSCYGTNPVITFRFILYTAIIHSLIIYSSLDGNHFLQSQIESINQFKSPLDCFRLLLVDFFDVLIYSFQTMTLQREKILDLQKIYNETPTSVYVANFMASILGPFLTVIFGLSIRTKIKRS